MERTMRRNVIAIELNREEKYTPGITIVGESENCHG